MSGDSAKLNFGSDLSLSDYQDYLSRLHQQKTYLPDILAALQLESGADLRLVDFGCGTGELLPLFARSGACRSVIGVDLKHEFLKQALRNLAGRDACFELLQSDCRKLGLASGSLDRVVAERLFLHLTEDDGRAVVREVYRTLASQGLFLVLDLAVSGISYRDFRSEENGHFSGLTEVLLRKLRGLFKNGDAGKILPELMEKAGFSEVSTKVIEYLHSADSVSLKHVRTLRRFVEAGEVFYQGRPLASEEFEAWGNELLQAIAGGQYQVNTPLYLSVGRKS